VFFHVQNLLGIGHVRRASILAEAMAAHGLEVCVALGGPPVPGAEFAGCSRIQLPAARAKDASFQIIVDEDDRPIDDAWRERRLARLLAEFSSFRPDVLMLELFPFGRRQFRFELVPLIETARLQEPPAAIVCSLRDILVDKRDEARSRQIVAFARTFIDRILVHGDPRLIPLEASFPLARELSDRISYTGYVRSPSEPAGSAARHRDGRNEVIVSAGGGAVGEGLLRCAIQARSLSRLSERVWRLIAGPNFPGCAYEDLRWNQPPGIVVERWRSDLPLLLRNCLVSLSQAGYNTVMDLLAARARAVVVPFSAAGETEQGLRARILAERGLVQVVDAAQLSPKLVASQIDEALTRRPAKLPLDVEGAKKTARLVAALCGADRA
jgi:predicted glycosyltransferase